MKVFFCSWVQELRKGKTIRTNSVQRDVLHTIAELQLPVESTIGTSGGAHVGKLILVLYILLILQIL